MANSLEPVQAGTLPGPGFGHRLIRTLAWLTKAKFTHGALVIVRDQAEQLLFVREQLRERDAWGFPGGFMRVGETARDAAVRELREETGLEVDPDELLLIAEYRQPWAWHYDHLFYLEVDSTVMRLRSQRDRPPGMVYRFRKLVRHIVGESLEIRTVKWCPSWEQPTLLTRAAHHAMSVWGWEPK